ncbi:MAG: sulfite exporter TauE/SafE family protein, partial [Planctomycetota bacterium]
MMILSILFGAIVGVSLGLTGGGGAIFAVPMLTYGSGLSTRESVAISLVSVGLTSLVGFLKKWRQGEAELRTGLIFAFAGMLGAPLGAWLSRRIAEPLLMLMMAGLMITIAVVMWRKAHRDSSSSPVCVPVEPRRISASHDRADGPRCQRDASGTLLLTSRCTRLLM